ncbi:MAG: TetR/AcrR family transcriptional regulator [Alphaproteobacteria bacterium]|nr:TetR/AcrR family transcriptional regulator [Alphaproteobacteria bacterium]MCW5740577.1 TetR/AcrR family transcriptional regulator [Alphaproteobacteria bacterium]
MVKKDERRPRGRPRAYDPERAMDRATATFWRAGYSATSLDDLTAATGMNKPSLYGAFGDKRALYLAALERYTEAGRVTMVEALRPDLPLRDGLQRVYDSALRFYLPADEAARGCFLIGTATTESVEDADVRKRLRDALRLYDSVFEARLAQAREQGEIAADADPAALARIASAVMHTLALRSRAGDPETMLRDIARAGIDLICVPERRRPKRR